MARNRRVFEEAMRAGADAAWDRNWDQAIAAYQRALNEFPNDVSALTGLGVAYFGAGQFKTALEPYQQASKLAPDDPALHEHIGKTLEQLGQGAEAAEAYLASAERYLDQQQAPHLALERWQDAARVYPNCLPAHAQLLRYYHRSGQVREAVQECLALARISRAQGQYEYAIQACNYALKLAPHDPQVLRTLDELRHGERAAIAAGAELAHVESKPGAAVEGVVAPALFDFPVTPVTEPDQERGSPIEITRQRALSDLAESLFEDEATATALSAAPPGLDKAQLDTLVGRAIDCQTRGMVEEAIAAYEQLLGIGLRHPAVYFNLGLLYQHETRFDIAIPQLERAMSHPDYALGSHFALGECYRAQGHTDRALKHFAEVFKMVDLATVQEEQAAELAQLYDGLADAAIARNEREQVLEFTNSLVEFFSQKDWKVRISQARRRLDALADEGPALSLAEMLAIPGADRSSSERILESLALAQEHARQGMFYTALEECYHALRLAPTYLLIHRQVSRILLTMGKVEEAVSKMVAIADTYRMRGDIRPSMAMYKRALKLAPMDTGVRTKLIDLLVSQGEIDEALEHYLTLADSYYHLAQIDQSRETYQEALRLAPRGSHERQWRVRILHKIGDIYLQRVDWKRAIEVYEQIRKLAPNDQRARSTLIDLYYRSNRPDLALAELDSLMRVCHESGEAGRIFESLEELVRQRPDDIPLRTRLAQAHLDAGHAEQALEHLDKLGDLQLEAGRYEDARETIQIIIALQPPNVVAYQQLLDQLGEPGADRGPTPRT